MRKSLTVLATACALTACENGELPIAGGFAPATPTTPTTPTTPPTTPVSVGGVELPKGTGSTETVSAGAAIMRYETDGEAQDVTYDAATDTISIDNLPFDADGTYDRDDVLATLVPSGFQVYENNNTTERRAYKAIRGISASGETSFTVVGTGDYRGYGFGGFVYSRNGSVTLPTTGQATYTGQYTGMRLFDGTGGQQYTTADATIEVDFEDFNATDAVEGFLTNRQYFDTSGALIGVLPTLVLLTGSISTAGEIGGTAASRVFVPGTGGAPGTFEEFEAGEYYAVLSGDPANEMVGIIVVTGVDPNDGNPLSGGPDVTVRETGGFIVTSP